MRKVHAKSAQIQIYTVYSAILPILRYILTLDLHVHEVYADNAF